MKAPDRFRALTSTFQITEMCECIACGHIKPDVASKHIDLWIRLAVMVQAEYIINSKLIEGYNAYIAREQPIIDKLLVDLGEEPFYKKP